MASKQFDGTTEQAKPPRLRPVMPPKRLRTLSDGALSMYMDPPIKLDVKLEKCSESKDCVGDSTSTPAHQSSNANSTIDRHISQRLYSNILKEIRPYSKKDRPSLKSLQLQVLERETNDTVSARVPPSPTTSISSKFRSFSQNLNQTAVVLGVPSHSVTQLLDKNGINRWAAIEAMAALKPSTPTTPTCDEPVISSNSGENMQSHLPHGQGQIASIHIDDSPGHVSQGVKKRMTHISSDKIPPSPTKTFPLSAPNQQHPTRFEKSSTILNVLADDLETKQDFLILLAKTFAMYGAPSHRLEFHLTSVSECLGIEGNFHFFPSLMMITFGNELSSKSKSHIIHSPQGFNMSKLAKVNALCITITRDLIDINDALLLLESIKSSKDYPWYLILLTFPITSFVLCLTGFGGNWWDAVISAGLGVLVGTISHVSELLTALSYLLVFIASFITSFLASILSGYLSTKEICINTLPVTLSSLVILLPGLSLTIAIIELSTRNIVSGTVRLFSALFTAMVMGFGLTLGGALVTWVDNTVIENTVCNKLKESTGGAEISLLWLGLLFIPMSISFNIYFQAHYRQWPIMTVSACAGWLVSLLLSRVSVFTEQPSAKTALVSVVIGLLSNIYSRITHDVAVAPILAAILLQVPGSLGVKSTLKFMAGSDGGFNNTVDGAHFTLQMMTIGMSLAFGLFLASIIVWPLRNPKFRYQTI